MHFNHEELNPGKMDIDVETYKIIKQLGVTTLSRDNSQCRPELFVLRELDIGYLSLNWKIECINGEGLKILSYDAEDKYSFNIYSQYKDDLPGLIASSFDKIQHPLIYGLACIELGWNPISLSETQVRYMKSDLFAVLSDYGL